MQYNAANREVAILCNHQRTLPKNWDENREKKKQQLDVVQHQVDELKDMLQKVKAGKKVPLMPEKYQAAIPKLEIPEGTSPEEAEKMKQEYSEKRAERAKFSHMYKSQPTEKQVEGLCFGTATPEQKAATRASWGTWDIIHTCIILAFTVAFYIYFW